MLNRTRKLDWIGKFSFVLFIALFTSFLLITCYKAPVAGRSQLILISEEEANQMGVTAFQEVLSKEKVSNNAVYNEAVTRVAGRITGVSVTPRYNWDYKVFKDDKTINAFALPGGKIGVYSGIIPVAMNDAGLATVLGHEVAHVAAHHGADGIGVTVGGILPFSRTQESEADRIGLIYMAKAGYHPGEAIDFWNRMELATQNKPRPPEFPVPSCSKSQ